MKGLKHRYGTREVVEFGVEDFNLDVLEAFVSLELGRQSLLMLIIYT